MKNNLTKELNKNNKHITQHLNPNHIYTTTNNNELTLHGHSLLFVHNVNHLMSNPAIIDNKNHEIPKNILNTMITNLITLHDLKHRDNSHTNSIYIVKPKMHKPFKMTFTNELFDHVEQLLNIPTNTLKMNIMNKKQHTNINLKTYIETRSTQRTPSATPTPPG